MLQFNYIQYYVLGVRYKLQRLNAIKIIAWKARQGATFVLAMLVILQPSSNYREIGDKELEN